MSRGRDLAIDYTYALKGRGHTYHGRKPPKQYKTGSKGDVILIPGLYERWHFLKHIGDELAQDGYRVHAVDSIKNNRQSVDREAKKLHEYIQTNELKHVAVVAHSKGGLVGLHYMLKYAQKDHVRKLIAIATPFSGSNIGKVFRTRAAKELLPSSETIQGLVTDQKAVANITSIYPEYDNHVWHPDKSFLPGAKNIELPIHGHHKIVFDPKLLGLIRTELAQN